jgi:glycosyltransferase involved in cell wall biosynthesis
MAKGSPIVATDVGGISEILSNNRNGLVAPAADAKALAAAIIKVVDNPDLAVRLGEQAARDCVDKYDPRKIAKQTLDFYSAVIDAYKVSALAW